MGRRAVRAVATLAVVGALAVPGCVAPSIPASNVRDRAQAKQSVESTAVRASLERYLRNHPDEVRRPLVTTQSGDPVMSRTQANASKVGTPVIVWDYDASRVTSSSGDAWHGLIPQIEHAYMMSVTATGAPPLTMKVWDMPHFWVPFIFSHQPLEAEARSQLDRYFGTRDYEFCFVESGALWGLARREGRVAGVAVECHRPREVWPPQGVLAGTSLVRAMGPGSGGE